MLGAISKPSQLQRRLRLLFQATRLSTRARFDTQEVGCPDPAALFSDIVEDLAIQEVRETGVQDIPYFLGVLNLVQRVGNRAATGAHGGNQ